jgi:tetratricopeptide (TPR) repeat protein
MLKNLLAPLCLVCILLGWQPAARTQSIPNSPPAVEELLRSAAISIQSGDLKSAEGNLRKAVSLAPNDIAALSMLGGVLGMQRNLEESSTFFEKAVQLDPANPDLRRNLAANQLQLGRTSAAIRNLQALLRFNPGDRQAILMLGLSWERAQDFQRAVATLEQVPDLVRQQPESIAALVRSYYRTGQKARARRQLSELQGSSSNPAAIYLGGQIAIEAKDWETAERLFTSIQARHPQPSLVDYQLARIRYETGRYEESKQLLEPIANSPESNGSVLNLLAWCYAKEGDEETAEKILLFAVDHFPAEPANFVDLGRLYLKDSNLDKALQVAQRGTVKHPGSGPLFELKGELESRQGLHAKSVQSYKQAVRLNPRSPDALLGLALAQTNLLQNKDAVASLEKGLELFPRDPRFYAEYGKVLLLPWASGEMPGAGTKAEQLLLKAIQLDGSLAMARFELGSLLVKSQRPADAVPHLEKAIQLEPENAQAHFILARAYRALGRTQDAERQLLIFQNLQTAASGKKAAPPPKE